MELDPTYRFVSRLTRQTLALVLARLLTWAYASGLPVPRWYGLFDLVRRLF